MGNVISITDAASLWKTLFEGAAGNAHVHVYGNARTKALELVLVNDEGEAITANLTPEAAKRLRAKLQQFIVNDADEIA